MIKNCICLIRFSVTVIIGSYALGTLIAICTPKTSNCRVIDAETVYEVKGIDAKGDLVCLSEEFSSGLPWLTKRFRSCAHLTTSSTNLETGTKFRLKKDYQLLRLQDGDSLREYVDIL